MTKLLSNKSLLEAELNKERKKEGKKKEATVSFSSYNSFFIVSGIVARGNQSFLMEHFILIPKVLVCLSS